MRGWLARSAAALIPVGVRHNGTPVRHHPLVAEPGQSEDPLDDHAARLWLARAIASPDTWRLRATNTAGLLSAAAAATVAGLIFRDGRTSELARFFAIGAAIAYIIAVTAYLIAGVWPSPKRDQESRALAEDTWQYCYQEARPIKLIIAAATLSAVVAIMATGATLVAVVNDGRADAKKALVSIVATDTRSSLLGLCPELPPTFQATVEEVTADRLRISLPADECGSAPASLEVRRDDVILKYAG